MMLSRAARTRLLKLADQFLAGYAGSAGIGDNMRELGYYEQLRAAGYCTYSENHTSPYVTWYVYTITPDGLTEAARLAKEING